MDFLSDIIIKISSILACVFLIVNLGVKKGEVISENKNVVDFIIPDGEVYSIYGTDYEIGSEYILLFWGEKIIYTI